MNGTARHLKGIKTGLLLEAKKPLERTPHFFEPGVGECVNALGQLVDGVGVEPTFYDAASCTPQCYPPILVPVFPDSHLGQRIGRTTKNQNARIAATPKIVTGTQYHLVRLLGVRVQNQIRNPIVERDRTAATIIGNI